MPDALSLLADAPLWVVAPSHWREACFSLPASRALAEHHAIHLLCPTPQKDFWQAAGFEKIEAFDPSIKHRALAKDLPDIQQCLLWEDGVGAKAMAHAGVPLRVGLPAAGLAKCLTRSIDPTQRPGPPNHHVRRFLDSAIQLGAGPFEPHHFSPLESSVERQTGALLISPDSDFGSHYTWPAERWHELLENLSLPRELVHLHDSGPVAGHLAKSLGLSLTGSLAPQQYAAFDYCLAADSSPAHIAASFGVTCAVLFGPGDPEQTRPLGKKHFAIRHKAECSPCLLGKCPLDLRCQLELDIQAVRDALNGFMGA